MEPKGGSDISHMTINGGMSGSNGMILYQPSVQSQLISSTINFGLGKLPESDCSDKLLGSWSSIQVCPWVQPDLPGSKSKSAWLLWKTILFPTDTNRLIKERVLELFEF